MKPRLLLFLLLLALVNANAKTLQGYGGVILIQDTARLNNTTNTGTD